MGLAEQLWSPSLETPLDRIQSYPTISVRTNATTRSHLSPEKKRVKGIGSLHALYDKKQAASDLEVFKDWGTITAQLDPIPGTIFSQHLILLVRIQMPDCPALQ